MMKKLTRAIALALALILALGCAGLAESADDPVAYRIDGQEIRVSEILDMAKLLYDNGYIETEDDYLTALNYVTYGYVYEKMFGEYGLKDFTDEEMAAFETEADTTWDASVRSYVDYYNTSENPTDEELAALQQQAEDYFASRGTTRQAILDNLIRQACYDRLDQYLIDTYGLEATREDVLKALDDEVAAEKEYFEGNVSMYEMYKYYGYNLYYRPAGYRGVLQILLEVDSGLLEEYLSAQAALEEEGADAEAAAARLEAARQAVMDSKQAVIDEIYARLVAGEKFVDLIPDYNIDPGMQNEDYLRTGYEVHRDSATYDVPFVDAAFDETMNAVGDVSGPHIGRYGIYIVYYHRDIPEGMVEVTEEEIESIRESLTNSTLNQKISEEFYPEWESGCVIEYVDSVLFSLNISVDEDGKTLSRIENEPAAAE